jgi:broad specificity phosphatase PhoE
MPRTRLAAPVPSILLIRHGQASFASEDYDVLSETGARQAALVHRTLAPVVPEPASLISGSLRRQLDTATPWTGQDPALTIDPRFNEYDAGDVLGAHAAQGASLERPVDAAGQPLSSRDFQTLLDEALGAWIDAGAQGGASETWAAFSARCTAGLEAAMDGLGKGETGLVFTSGGVIGALAAALLGLPDRSMIAFNHVSVNGSISKVVGGRRGLSLISFNEHLHLEGEGLVTYR